MKYIKRIIAYILSAALLMCGQPSISAAAVADDNTIDIKDGFVNKYFYSEASFACVYGIGGKSQSDESAFLTASGANFYYDSSSVTIDTDKIYYFETNVLLGDNISQIFVATKQHTQISDKLSPDALIKNSWNKIQFIYEPAKGISHTYINGVSVSNYTLSDKALTYMNTDNSGFRLVLAAAKSGDTYLQSSAYFDNIRLYTSDTVAPDTDVAVDNGDYPTHLADNASGILYCDSATAAKVEEYFRNSSVAFANVIYNGEQVGDNVLVKDGYQAVLTDYSNVSRVYAISVLKSKAAVAYGSAVQPDGKFASGVFSVYSKAAAGDMLVVAQYTSLGRLISLETAKEVVNKRIMLDFEPASTDGSKIKIMLWNGTTLMPYNPSREYKYIYDDIYSTNKTNGYTAKSHNSIIFDENFDQYSGSALGNAWMITSGSGTTVKDDELCGGKYLSVKGSNVVKKFFKPSGGNVRFDMQLAVSNDKSYASFNMFGFNYSSEESNLISSLVVDGTQLYTLTTGGALKPVKNLEVGEWYNLSLYYNTDNRIFNIYIDDVCMMPGIQYQTLIGSFGCFDIKADTTSYNDFAVDNIRLSNITTEEISGANPDYESDVLFDDNFDSYANGTIITEGTAGNVSYTNDGKNGYAYAQRTSDTGGCSSLFYFPYVADDVTFEFDVYLEDNSGATKVVSINGGINCSIYFTRTSLVVYGPTERTTVKSDITVGQWHHVRMVTDMGHSTYQLYFDGECLAEKAPMLEKKSSYINRFRFAVTSGQPSSYRMDNAIVKRNYTYTGDYEVIEGYSTDSDAPASYDWQKLYVSQPGGDVYQAENMTLNGYVVAEDALYDGQKYVRTQLGAMGSADFTFVGSSGYYAINVGYGESQGAYDSYFELKRNGERIDWWVGQNDAAHTYVRQSKRYFKVNNGDLFTVCGVGCKDPAMLDYVEFVPAGDLAPFEYGDLIEDDGTHPGAWLSSGWDNVEDGGYVRYGKTVYDCRTDAHCELIRDIYPVDRPFVFDYTMKVNTSSNCYVKLGDGEAFPVAYKFGGKAITVGGKTISNAFANTATLKYRIYVDTYAKTFDILVDGNPIATDAAFDGDIDKFSQIRFETSDAGTSHFIVSAVKLSAGYNVFETFRPYTSGKTPYDWSVTGATVQTMLSEGADAQSLRINANGTAQKTFDKIDGKITFETYFILPASKDGACVQLGSGDKHIGFYTKDGHIWYDTNLGSDGVVWENYKSNIWYTLRIEADTSTGKASYYVNDFASVKEVDVSLDGADCINFVSGSDSGYMWIDDISIFNSIYSSQVPQPEIPEHRGDYNIVMETCDLWREGNHFGYAALAPFDNRLPLLGYLEDGNLEVTDWETKFMVEHGITVYAPCWYTNAGSKDSPVKDPRNSAKLHAFLKSEYSRCLDFAILVTTVPADVTLDSFIEHHVNYWIERYFKAPNYWKIDNKPVIPIYTISSFVTLSGSDQSLILRRIDEALTANGFDGGIYLGTLNGSVTTANGYSAKFKYHQGDAPTGTTVIKNLLANQSSDSVTFIASPSQGFGNEAWGRNIRKINVPLDEWYGSLKWIRDTYMPGQPEGSFAANTLWLGNWNEYSEGHSLAPSKLTGFGYLEGVRSVFTYGDGEHFDELPDKSYDYMTPFLWQ